MADDAYYRCLIVAIREATVRIYFIDFGNFEEVGRDCLKRLPESLDERSRSPLAVRCRFSQAGDSQKHQAMIELKIQEYESIQLKVDAFDAATRTHLVTVI